MNEDKKKPVDVGGILGQGLQLLNTAIEGFKSLAPTDEEKRINKACRQLKNRYKGMSVEDYIDLFYKGTPEEEKGLMRAAIKARLFPNDL